MRETPPEVNANGSSASSDQPAPGVDPAVLACHDVTKSYGGVLAVDSVSLEVPRPGLFGLCGFNGAGKSTLFNLLAGSVRADSGSVRIDGRDATGWSAMRRARSGVARTWQTVRLAHGRTAVDNVAAACLRDPGQWMLASLWRSQAAPARERAWAALESSASVTSAATRRRADPGGPAADRTGQGDRQRAHGAARRRARVRPVRRPADRARRARSPRSARTARSSSWSTTWTCSPRSAGTCGRWWRGGSPTRATWSPSAPRRCTRACAASSRLNRADSAPLLTATHRLLPRFQLAMQTFGSKVFT